MVMRSVCSGSVFAYAVVAYFDFCSVRLVFSQAFHEVLVIFFAQSWSVVFFGDVFIPVCERTKKGVCGALVFLLYAKCPFISSCSFASATPTTWDLPHFFTIAALVLIE